MFRSVKLRPMNYTDGTQGALDWLVVNGKPITCDTTDMRIVRWNASRMVLMIGDTRVWLEGGRAAGGSSKDFFLTVVQDYYTDHPETAWDQKPVANMWDGIRQALGSCDRTHL